MFNRRNFLKTSSLVALSPTVPAFLQRAAQAAEPQPDERILVVVQLDGGNDGINTVVPFADEAYAANRKTLRLRKESLLKLNDSVGLHPSMREAAELFEQQRLAIVQGVGYPNPNRSHDVSMAIWHTARFDREEHDSYGWVGRALDQLPTPKRNAPSSALIGRGETPGALLGRKCVSSSFSSLNELHVRAEPSSAAQTTSEFSGNLKDFVHRSTVDAYAIAELLRDLSTGNERPNGAYPSSELASQLQLTAQLIKADIGTRVYYAVQSGYDTHSAQLSLHPRLLAELSGAIGAFLDDLSAAKLEDRVLVMCFSEFGRQVRENASAGTDHGTAGPLLLAGSAVAGGLLGEPPNLHELERNAPRHTTDFRSIYASIAEQWLNVRAQRLLEGEFDQLPLFA